MKPQDLELCETCVLPDCYPKDPRCPVKRKKAEEKGIVLPDAPKDLRVIQGSMGAPRKYEDVAPATWEDKKDYQRQYGRKYMQRFRKVLVRGIFIKREDVEFLQETYAMDGRKLEDELTLIVEKMVENARAKKSIDGGDLS